MMRRKNIFIFSIVLMFCVASVDVYSFQIEVKTFFQENFEIGVEKKDTIFQVKQKIQDKKKKENPNDWNPKNQSLSFSGGSLIENERTLESYGIDSSDDEDGHPHTIDLHIKIKTTSPLEKGINQLVTSANNLVTTVGNLQTTLGGLASSLEKKEVGGKIIIIEKYHGQNLTISEILKKEFPDAGPKDFEKVKVLKLYFNGISKIEGLDALTNLEKLDLGGNKITKIEGLEKLVKLKELNLKGNQISKIEGLDKLENLEKLDLESNQITQIEGLESLKELKTIHLLDNPKYHEEETQITKDIRKEFKEACEKFAKDNNKITVDYKN